MKGEKKELTRRRMEYLLIVATFPFRCQLTEVAERMNVTLPSISTTRFIQCQQVVKKVDFARYTADSASSAESRTAHRGRGANSTSASFVRNISTTSRISDSIAVMQKLYLWIRWTLGIGESHALLQAAALTACLGKESCEAVLRAAAEGILSCGEKQKKTTPDQRQAEEALRKPRRRKIQPFGTEHPVMLRSGDPSARREVPPDAVSIL